MYKIITPSPAQWDAFVLAQPNAHLLQLSAWGDLKRAYGWEAVRVAMTENAEQIVGGAQILFRRLPFRLGTIAYLPMGPYPTQDTPPQLWYTLHATSRDHHARFFKWEPGHLDSPPDFTGLGFVESLQTIQPPRTILIDISGDTDSILARMNQGTRRKIRQSLKNGVTYYEGTRADIAKYTRMMQATGTRNAFGVHTPDYYETAHALFTPDHAALFMAEHDGDVLAGIMVFAVGDTAWYLYGASSDVKRNLMASYGVQWQAILWAKARGCHFYDLWGIPDEDEATLEAQFQQRDDGLWGVYGFKRGWGGTVVRSPGAWDKVYSPLVYKAYQMALRLRGYK